MKLQKFPVVAVEVMLPAARFAPCSAATAPSLLVSEYYAVMSFYCFQIC
jgi:hypothetical protein